MRFNRVFVVLTAIMILILTACQSNQNDGGPEIANQPQPTQANQTAANSGQGSSEGTDQGNSDSSTGSAGNVSAPPSASATTSTNQDNQNPNGSTNNDNSSANHDQTDQTSVEKIYHMNKNYFIKPNDPDKTGSKVVLLTFDDGPKKKDQIESIIETLNKHHAKAIFYEVGQEVKAHPDLLQYTYNQGETIGNHTYTHPSGPLYLKDLPDEKIDEELEKTSALINQTIGIEPQFFRPPNAAGNDYVHQKVKDMGMLYMTWSDGSGDWMPKYENKPQEIIDFTMSQLHPGSIILMHELPWTVELLDDLLTKIEEKGYTFVDPQAIDRNYTEKDDSNSK